MKKNITNETTLSIVADCVLVIVTANCELERTAAKLLLKDTLGNSNLWYAARIAKKFEKKIAA